MTIEVTICNMNELNRWNGAIPTTDNIKSRLERVIDRAVRRAERLQGDSDGLDRYWQGYADALEDIVEIELKGCRSGIRNS